jgi:SAM-dependent methyltransferase
MKYNGHRPVVQYGLSKNAWEGFSHYLISTIEKTGSKDICEIGGGANPALPIEQVSRLGIKYSILDVSQDELDKAPPGYNLVRGDATDRQLNLTEQYDLVFSKMLMEHIPSARHFHENVRRMLKPGGVAFHFFPTLYAIPFVLNRLLPERFAESIVHTLQPGLRSREGKRSKFPAFYQWCRGPTLSQISRLQQAGYEVVEYIGFFGHSNYYRRVPALATISLKISRFLLSHPNPWLTSFAYLVVKKPHEEKSTHSAEGAGV